MIDQVISIGSPIVLCKNQQQESELHKPLQPRISPPDTPLEIDADLRKRIKKMSRPLHDLNLGLHASLPQRFHGAHALLPGDQVIGSAMDQESRGAVGAAQDLGVGRDGLDLRFGRRGGEGGSLGGTVEEEGDGLGAPVHVQDESPAGVRE